jgi:hypothetical protein
MYLVSPEYLNANNTKLPPIVSKESKMPPLPKKRPNKKSKRSVKKKNATKLSTDSWITLGAILREDDLARKREIKKVADFLKKLLPTTELPATQSFPKTPLLYEALKKI